MIRKIFILVFGFLMLLSCKVTEPQKPAASQTEDSLSNYTLIVRIRNAGDGMFGDIFSQVQFICGQYNLVQMDWDGVSGEPKTIRARFQRLPQKTINTITTKIYGIPNIIGVEINKN